MLMAPSCVRRVGRRSNTPRFVHVGIETHVSRAFRQRQGGDVLIFRMEILAINGPTKPADKCDPESLKGCNDKQKAYVGSRCGSEVWGFCTKRLAEWRYSMHQRHNGVILFGAASDRDQAGWGLSSRAQGRLQDGDGASAEWR